MLSNLHDLVSTQGTCLHRIWAPDAAYNALISPGHIPMCRRKRSIIALGRSQLVCALTRPHTILHSYYTHISTKGSGFSGAFLVQS